ncbi:MAG: hypothetical protein AAFR81_26640 [Chloroflexota bacterium]
MSGRTLLLPTPYAIKMALTDRAIVKFGLGNSQEIFPYIRDLSIDWAGPLTIGVMQVTEKGYRLEKSKTKTQVKIQEHCTYSGSFYLRFENKHSNIKNDLSQLIRMLFRIGKSGSVVNCEYVYSDVTTIDRSWHSLCDPIDYSEVTRGTVQRMDDMQNDVTLADISKYHLSSRIKTRIQYDIIIPYRLGHASENFVAYERINR